MCYFRQALDAKLKEDPPEDGRPPAEVMEWVAREVLPFATRLDHPRCFAFIPSAPTWPGVLADFMAAGYNFNQSTWLVASGPSAIELVVIDWLKGWIGYPEGAGGLLTSRGSAASVDAFVAVREAAGNPHGATVYMSDQSHSAQVRAARITGVKQEHMRLLPTDERYRLDVEALARAVVEDRAAGLHPSRCAPTPEPAAPGPSIRWKPSPISARRRASGSTSTAFAMVTEKGKELLRGIERTDSVNLDGHKWFFQPYEVGGLLVKDASTLEKAFEVHHDVLQDTILGRQPPELLGPRAAVEPLGPGLEDMDVGADLRHGRIPSGGVPRDGAGGPGRRVRAGECHARYAEPGLAGDRVLPGEPSRP